MAAISQGLVVEQLILTSHRRLENNVLDLLEYYASLEIVEDIYSNSITGTLVLNEIHNLVSSPIDNPWAPGPIIGNETITVVFREANNNITLDPLSMIVYKIGSRTLSNTKVQTTVLHLVGKEFVKNATVRVSKSYINKKYSDIVSEVLTEKILDGEKMLDIETTDKPKNFILPNWSPYTAINWMASRSISPTYKGASYMFFETLNGVSGHFNPTLHFSTLEKLYTLSPVKTLTTTIANVVDQTVEPGKYVDMNKNRINKYDFDRTFNILDNLKGGMYGNRLIQHDILNKSIEVTDFDYKKTYTNYEHSETNKGNGRLISALTQNYTTYPEQNISLYIKNKAMYAGLVQDDTMKTYIPVRKSQLQQLSNIRILVTIPGNASISVGQSIMLEITSPKNSPDINNSTKVFDTYYAGKFLVTCVRHLISAGAPSHGVYSLSIELSKDTLDKNPLTESSLPGGSVY